MNYFIWSTQNKQYLAHRSHSELLTALAIASEAAAAILIAIILAPISVTTSDTVRASTTTLTLRLKSSIEDEWRELLICPPKVTL